VLELLDGAAKTEGVIVVGATNRPDKIDPAILRSGRLERHIVVPAPDTAALVQIIAHHLGSDLDAVLNSIEVGGSVGGIKSPAALTEPSNTTTADNRKTRRTKTMQECVPMDKSNLSAAFPDWNPDPPTARIGCRWHDRRRHRASDPRSTPESPS
jgi:SpoVK/Ycf46/Vps4 family AAA+-type ATPase